MQHQQQQTQRQQQAFLEQERRQAKLWAGGWENHGNLGERIKEDIGLSQH